MLQHIVILMIIAIALGMAYKRYAKNERGYAGA